MLRRAGLGRFDVLRRRRNEAVAFLYAFDLLELNGTDLRREPIEVRKATLAWARATGSGRTERLASSCSEEPGGIPADRSARRKRIGRNDPLGTFGAEEGLDAHAQHWAKDVQRSRGSSKPNGDGAP